MKTFQNLGAQIYKSGSAGTEESPKAETSEPQQQETSEKEVKPETPDEPIDVNYDKKEE